MVASHGVCLPAGSGTGTCVTDVQCAAGSVCIGSNPDAMRCAPLCDLTDGGVPCAAGVACEAVALDPRQPTLVSRTYGVCAGTSPVDDGGVADAGR
jgi:hypothetical protein